MKQLIATGLLLGCGLAQAETVSSVPCPIDSGFTCITAVDGLDIQGSMYDMVIVTGTFDGLFPDPSALDSWSDQDFADAAAEAIAGALNAFMPLPTFSTAKFNDNGDFPSSDEFNLQLPVEFDSLGYAAACVSLDGVLGPGARATGCSSTVTGDQAFATFALVPIPAAAWLLISGLGVLGWPARRSGTNRP